VEKIFLSQRALVVYSSFFTNIAAAVAILIPLSTNVQDLTTRFVFVIIFLTCPDFGSPTLDHQLSIVASHSSTAGTLVKACLVRLILLSTVDGFSERTSETFFHWKKLDNMRCYKHCSWYIKIIFMKYFLNDKKQKKRRSSCFLAL